MSVRTGSVATGQEQVLRRRMRRTWPQRLLIAFGILTSLSLVLGAGGLAYGLNRFKSITFIPVPNLTASTPGKPTNWLLVGSDSRAGISKGDPNSGAFLGEGDSGARTDTIILARVDPANKTVDLLSIPRDLWVPIAGTGQKSRINSAFNGTGGQQRLIQTVQDTLGVQINNYAEVNFNGFADLVNAVGGVPIYFSNAVRDDNSGLFVKSPGCVTLDGVQAVAFVRSRHLEYQENGKWKEDVTSDIGREARQQFIITRLADIAKSKLDLSNIGTVNRLLTVGGRNLSFDNSVTPEKLFNLGKTFGAVGSAGIRRHSLTVTPFTTAGGADVLNLDDDGSLDEINVFRDHPTETRIPPSTETVARAGFTVDVLNGAGTAKLAAKASQDLKTAGFTVGTSGDSRLGTAHTTVRYPKTLAAAAATVGGAMVYGPRYQLDDTVTNVTVVLGSDYKGVNPPPAPGKATTTTSTAPAVSDLGTSADNPVGVGPGPAGTACAAA